MDLSRAAWMLILVYILMFLFANFLMQQRFPKIPGDIFVDKVGFRVYIPFASPIVITIILSLVLGTFFK